MGLFFGTAGVPLTSRGSDSVSGIERVRELGLDCMELEFVQGVKMKESTARLVAKASLKEGVRLTAHAPYFINLNSKDKGKREASRGRLFQAALISGMCGAEGIAFHPAFYQGNPPEEVYRKVAEEIRALAEKLRVEGIRVILRPETTGKETQFGSLEEILSLSSEIPGVGPCLDFAHLHARTGKENSYREFAAILELVGERLGQKALEDLHIHISGIDYGPKGERRHLNLKDSDFRYRELLKALRDFQVGGVLICESPNLERDALMLKRTYKSL